MKDEYDFKNAHRGRFFRPHMRKKLPQSLSAFMDMILPPDVAVVPCPRCGKTPKLVEGSKSGEPPYRYATTTVRYQCRKWFGLRVCASGPAVTEEREWYDYARKRAANAWNKKMIGYALGVAFASIGR